MQTLPFKARLVRKNHSAIKAQVDAKILTDGIHIPIRFKHDRRIFEIVRIEADGLLIYREENFFRR